MQRVGGGLDAVVDPAAAQTVTTVTSGILETIAATSSPVKAWGAGAAFAPLLDKLTSPGYVLAGKRDRFVIVGCENVAHFGTEVATGKAIDLPRAAPGLVQLARKAVRDHPKLRGILLECSQMPPFSGVLRDATGLPTWDATHAIALFHDGWEQNPRIPKIRRKRRTAHPLPRLLPPGSSFLELAPAPAQLTKGIVFNADMGGGGLYSTWHYYSVLHILLSFGMLLFWWLMFFFPYRVLFFQGGR